MKHRIYKDEATGMWVAACPKLGRLWTWHWNDALVNGVLHCPCRRGLNWTYG